MNPAALDLFRALVKEADPAEAAALDSVAPGDFHRPDFSSQPLGLGVEVFGADLMAPYLWAFVEEMIKAGFSKIGELIGEEFWQKVRSEEKKEKLLIDATALQVLRRKLEESYTYLNVPLNMRARAAEATTRVFLENPALLRRLVVK